MAFAFFILSDGYIFQMEESFENHCATTRRNSSTNLTTMNDEVVEPSRLSSRLNQLHKMHRTLALIDKNMTGVRNIKCTLLKNLYLDVGHHCSRLLGCLGTFCRSLYLGDGHTTWGQIRIISFSDFFSDNQEIPSEYRFIASLFCKSATAYNPFIYFFMFKGFREDTRNVLHR